MVTFGGIGPSIRSARAASDNPWLKHLRKYRRAHPNESVTDQAKHARRTYTPVAPDPAKIRKRRKHASKRARGYQRRAGRLQRYKDEKKALESSSLSKATIARMKKRYNDLIKGIVKVRKYRRKK